MMARHPAPGRSLVGLRRSLGPGLVLGALALGCGSSDESPQGTGSAGGQGGAAGSGAGAAGLSGGSGQGGAGAAGQSGASQGGAGGAGGAGGGGPDFGAIAAKCFSGGTEPIVRIGDQFAGATWNDPSVVQVDGQYVMYASASKSFGVEVQIYRLTSADGLAWTIEPPTPVLALGEAGSWDAGGVETPAVVQFDGKWHLFYTGYKTNTPAEFRLGHATSSDGIAWTKDATFLLGPSDPKETFYRYIVGEPGPVVVGDTLHVYFTGVSVDAKLQGTQQAIGRISLAKGTSAWSEPALALAPDQALFPRKDGYVGFSTPAAALLGGEVHLFVDLAFQPAEAYDQIALYHAHSADGLTGWVFDPVPLRSKADFPWTTRELRSPWPLLSGGTLQLYFAGDNALAAPKDFGIGRMDCALPGG